MDMVFAFMCAVCATHVPEACRVHKTAMDPLEVELQMVVAIMWVLESKPRSSGRAARTFNHQAILCLAQGGCYFTIRTLVISLSRY